MELNRKRIILVVAILIILLVIVGFLFYKNKKINNNIKNNVLITDDEYTQIDKNQISYQDNVTVDELKNSVGLIGDSNIYEIQEEFDGRKVLTVKAGLKYQVAFAGMIKKSAPTINELETLLNNNLPQYNGIWIEESSRDKMLDMFNSDKLNSKYIVDSNGYLQIDVKNEQNDFDRKIEKLINGDKLYILDISSVCYIVDEVTGEILDYNFENMDRYQTYEYFEDNGKMIVFISQNTRNLLTDSEILESVINLF